MKRTPLTFGTTPLKRTPLKRGASQLKRTSLERGMDRLNPLSRKRRAVQDARREFVVRVLAERPYCQGPVGLRALARQQLDGRDHQVIAQALRRCGIQRQATEVHEKLKRSRGGSILEAENVLALCHDCHRFTEEEPRLATLAGMLTPSWERAW